MEFVKSVNENELDKWLEVNKTSFLQSSLWQRILLATGQDVERVELRCDEKIVAATLLVYKKLPFGWRYAWCPKGPVAPVITTEAESRVEGSLKFRASRDSCAFAKASAGTQSTSLRFARNESIDVYNALLNYLKSQKCIFLRCEPAEKVDLQMKQVKEINPSATLVLDIQKSAEELLAQMHPKTRYNIRVAERKRLKISYDKNFSIFWELLKKTGERDSFILHSQENYEKVMADDAAQQITILSSDGHPIAAGGFIGFGNRYYYLYGALDYNARQLMAPYLLQWSAIQQGKQMGFKYYDFFGIAPNKNHNEKIKNQKSGEEYLYDSKHPYAGITRFKLGFGGITENAPGTFDLVIDKRMYCLYKFIRRLRSLM